MTNILSLDPHEFHQLVQAEPEVLRDLFHQFHTSSSRLSDDLINAFLGFEINAAEKTVTPLGLERQFGLEQYTYEATPYDYIRWIIKTLDPTKKDVFYDLGAGYGQVVFYTALTTPATSKGIELVPERVKQATTIKERFNITNASFEQGNVLESNYSDGTIFFLFNPFHTQTFRAVLSKLRQIAQHHHIKIVGWGGGRIDLLASEPWLYEYGRGENVVPQFPYPIHIFASNES